MQIIRYIISGGTATFVNLSVTWLLSRSGWNYLLVATSAFTVAVMVSFVMQKYVTFKEKELSGASRQFLTFVTIGLCNVLVNDFLVFIEVHGLGLHPLVLVEAISSVCIAGYSFFLYRYFIFANTSKNRTNLAALPKTHVKA